MSMPGVYPARPDLDRGSRLELARFHAAQQALDLRGIDAAGAEMLRGLRAAGDGESQTLLRRAPVVACRGEAGEEGVSRTDCGDRFDGRCRDLVEVALVVGALDRGDAALRPGDHGVSRAQLDQARQAVEQVLAIVELMADRSLRLSDVRGHCGGLGPDRGDERLA